MDGGLVVRDSGWRGRGEYRLDKSSLPSLLF